MKPITHKTVWQLLSLLIIDIAVFCSTNAGKVPSFMLIVSFVLLMATFYYLIRGLVKVARLYGLSVKRKHRLAGSITGLFGFLVALQSIGELNSRDIIVLLPLLFIGYAYSFYGLVGTSQVNLDI